MDVTTAEDEGDVTADSETEVMVATGVVLVGITTVPLPESVPVVCTLEVEVVAVDGIDRVGDEPNGEVLFPWAVALGVVVNTLPVPVGSPEIPDPEDVTAELEPLTVEGGVDTGTEPVDEGVETGVESVRGRERVGKELPVPVGSVEVPFPTVEVGSALRLRMLDRIPPRPVEPVVVGVAESVEVGGTETGTEAGSVPTTVGVLETVPETGLETGLELVVEVVGLPRIPVMIEDSGSSNPEDLLVVVPVADAVEESDVLGVVVVADAVSVDVPGAALPAVDAPGPSYEIPLETLTTLELLEERLEAELLGAMLSLLEVAAVVVVVAAVVEDSTLVLVVVAAEEVVALVLVLVLVVTGALPVPENEELLLLMLLLLLDEDGSLDVVVVLDVEVTTPPGPNVIPLLVVDFFEVDVDDEGEAGAAEVDEVFAAEVEEDN